MTESTQHNFQQKLEEGEAYEEKLDAHFQKWFKISKVSMAQQKAGLDRIFVGKRGRKVTVQYKSDSKTQFTDNAFIETASVSVLGWAYTCKADMLLYYCIGLEKIYVIRPEKLRTHLDAWKRKYRLREALNDGYITIGIAVPITIFESCCESVLCIGAEKVQAQASLALECSNEKWIEDYERIA